MSSRLCLVHPAKRPETGQAELDRLLHPDRFYDQPDDVLRDHRLSRAERRAILSSWASDACAVASCPTLRAAPYGKQPVPFEAIMEALKELDRMDAEFGRTFGQAPAASEPQHLDA